MTIPRYQAWLPLTLTAGLLLAGCGGAAPAATSSPAAPSAAAPASKPAAASASPAASAAAASKPAAASASPAASAPAGALIPVRMGAIANASQSYIPTLIREKGLDKKFGLDLQQIDLANVNQQWTGMRAGDQDVSSGSVLDLLRQRQGGLKAHAVRGFTGFGNEVVAAADKPYKKLSDLKGARVGTPSQTLLDWMILRAAGKKAESFDVGTDAQVVNSSPPLLNQQILKGQLDAALQFAPDFTVGPEAEGKLKAVTSTLAMLKAAGFDPESFYLTYNVADAWRDKYPAGTPKLVAAIDAAVNLLETDDSVWPALAKRSGMTDEKLLPQFVKLQREAFKTNFGQAKLKPTQDLFDEIIKLVGQEPVGVGKVDPEAFDFQSIEAAKKLGS